MATNDSDGFWRVAEPALLLLYGGEHSHRQSSDLMSSEIMRQIVETIEADVAVEAFSDRI